MGSGEMIHWVFRPIFARSRLRRLAGAALAGVVAALIAGELGRAHAQATSCVAPALVPTDLQADWCRIATQRGSAGAHLTLGRDLADKKRYPEAFRMLEAAAALGKPEASFLVGLFLLYGFHGEIDKRRALAAFEIAALGGVSGAFARIVSIYEGGHGAEFRDPKKMTMWILAQWPILGENWDDSAVAEAKRHGLSDADIADVRRRLEELIKEKKIVRQDVLCDVAPDVPRIEDVMWWWCYEGRKGNLRKAYHDAGRLLWSRGHAEEGLRMFLRSGELGDLDALVNVALYTAQGTGTPRDFPRAIALLEDAFKRGASVASGWLILIFEGKDFRGVAHPRDPMNATMWRFIPFFAADMTDLAAASAYGKQMGLTDDDVREAQRRAAAWVAEKMPDRRYRPSPPDEYPHVFERRDWDYFFPPPPGERGSSR